MEVEDERLLRVGEDTLEGALVASRSPDGRSRLAAAGAINSILPRLVNSSPNHLLTLLRILRNMCAGEASIQDCFIELDGPHAVAGVILPPTPEIMIVRAGIQVIGNASLAGERHRAAVWDRFFPAGFLDLARVRSSSVCDPLCMVLDTCCSSEGGRTRLGELCAVGVGLPIILQVITTACKVGYQEEWLGWFLVKSCIEEPYFSIIFSKLHQLNDLDIEAQFTMQQAFLLSILSCLNEQDKELSVSSDFPLFIFEILKESSETVDFTTRGVSILPTRSPAVDVLGYSLIILRNLCALDNPPGTKAPVDLLINQGIVGCLLGFLRDLGPPSSARNTYGRGIGQMEDMPSPLKLCPYKGFRRDVVGFIGNCLHRRKHVQDEIRMCDGILLLLQQCTIDEDNPYLKEWGLMAVRNLLEGNAENQHEVAELKLQRPVDTPEITNLGLRVDVDETTGRAKLVNIS